MAERLRFVFLGLSITSSWGNGHATTYRGLLRELAALGHEVLFLERDVPWYAQNRDLPNPPYARTELYDSLPNLRKRFRAQVESADIAVVGSYVPEGIAVGEWVLRTAQGAVAFYDIDTPVTLANVDNDECHYISREQIPLYQLYLSFTGGPVLERLEREFGSPMARPLYCSFDPQLYYPEEQEQHWDLGYLGTFSQDRQPALEELLLQPAREWPEGRFVVAGPQYPDSISWPPNVTHIQHLPPSEHREFYCSQRFTLNLTREDMRTAGYCPSVRLFEAAACGSPIISDRWEGLDTIFTPESEILTAASSREVLNILYSLPKDSSQEIGRRARSRVLSEHTAAHRARQLEGYTLELLDTATELTIV